MLIRTKKTKELEEKLLQYGLKFCILCNDAKPIDQFKPFHNSCLICIDEVTKTKDKDEIVSIPSVEVFYSYVTKMFKISVDGKLIYDGYIDDTWIFLTELFDEVGVTNWRPE